MAYVDGNVQSLISRMISEDEDSDDDSSGYYNGGTRHLLEAKVKKEVQKEYEEKLRCADKMKEDAERMARYAREEERRIEEDKKKVKQLQKDLELQLSKAKEKEIVEIVTAREKDVACCVCLTNIPNMLFVKCGHCCVCSQCSNDLKRNRCPMCREESDYLMRIYF